MKCYSCKRDTSDGNYLFDIGENKHIWMCNRCEERMEIIGEKHE
jgi:hypothetical protein